MKSGLRGGKPRDMATFKKGGTSRGAGAAKKGFDYQIYAKGGGVKKYAEGGATRKEYGGPESMPEWDVPQYSFSDIKKFFTGKSEEPKAVPSRQAPTKGEDELGGRPDLRSMPMPPPPAPQPSAQQRREATRRSPAQRRAMQMAVDAAQPPGGSARPIYPDVSQPPGGSARPRSDETPETESPGFRPQGPVMREGRRPLRDMETDLAVMEASRAAQAPYTRIPRAREPEVMRTLRRAVHGEERAREMEARGYAKGGKVKMAGGGSCRGMGAAQRGGKYTIK